jgi:hypothetical protein
MNRIIMLLVFFNVLVIITHAQVVIKGTVTDSATGLPLTNASVYLNNTSFGTTTNKNGGFSLSVNNLYSGELIISSVGYETFFYKLNIADAATQTFTFKLVVKEKLLTNIVIMNDAARQAALQIFKENFLGITEEADHCTIKNLDAVYFNVGENKNSLYAYADTALVIVNELLGYTIAFDLVEFSFDKVKNSTYFLGYARYEDRGDKKKWLKRRQRNYYGSTMHFYRSLTADQLKKEGFAVFEIRKPGDTAGIGSKKKSTINKGSYGIIVPAAASAFLTSDSLSNYYLFSKYQLMVEYNKAPEAGYYLSRKVLVRGLNRFGFTAYITLLADKVQLDANGIIHSPLAVIYDGYWVYEKLGNQLPFNYKPG